MGNFKTGNYFINGIPAFFEDVLCFRIFTIKDKRYIPKKVEGERANFPPERFLMRKKIGEHINRRNKLLCLFVNEAKGYRKTPVSVYVLWFFVLIDIFHNGCRACNVGRESSKDCPLGFLENFRRLL